MPQIFCALKCLFEDDDDEDHKLVRFNREKVASEAVTQEKLIEEYNLLAQRMKQHQLDIHQLGGGQPRELLPASGGDLDPTLAGHRGSGSGAAAGAGSKKPRVRWLPLRRSLDRLRGRTTNDYMRASGDEGERCCAQYAISGASSEEGSESEELPAIGGGAASGQSVSVNVEVPPGGETVFRLIVPSGSQVVVPLPEGTQSGDTVGFDLSPEQIAALPDSDVLALTNGRFLVEPGDGE